MLNLTTFEIALLILCAVLTAVLLAIMWWRIAGERVKALIAGWLALPLLWKIVLPVVFAGVSAPALFKGDDDKEIELQKLEYFQEIFAAGVYFTSEVAEALMANNRENHVNPVQSKKSISVSDEDIVHGYWLESVITNAYDYSAIPPTANEYWQWCRRGGYDMYRVQRFGEFAFPYGTNYLTRARVLSGGMIESLPAFAPLAITAAREYAYFVIGQSQFFWWYTSDNEGMVFRWMNILPDKLSQEPYDAEIALYSNGDFTTRSNEVAHIYRYINPDDWDDDGLANEIDASPKTGDGDFFGIASPLPEGANPQAYYWVELCATGIAKAATIRITCDGQSDLGNHVIIARANQVCRVPLLIGAEYTLESSSPVEIVAVSSPKVEVYNTFARRSGGCRIRYPLDLWFENVGGNLCELNASENVGAVVTNITGGCCMTDINLLGFKWCCSGNCGCSGGEHEVSGIATWEGYSRWVYSWVWCLCGSGNYPDEEEARAVNLSLSVPRVIFTNDDGGAEQSDLAPLKIEFSSSQETNGVIVLTHYKDLAAVRIWADSNKTDEVSMPFVWEIKNQSSGVTNFYVEGTHVSKNHQSVNFNLTWHEELLGDEKISINRKSTVYYPIANVINSTLWDNGRLCNPSGIIAGSNACFAAEFPKLEPPAEDIKWSIVEGPAAFVGGDRGSKVYVTATEPNQKVKLRVQVGDSVSRPIEFTAFTVDPLNVKLTVWIVRDDRGGYAARNTVEVTNMVAEVNRIYEQIGVSFYIDSISYTNKTEWLNLYEKRNNKEYYDRKKRQALVNVAKNTNGLELYFTNKLPGKTIGDHNADGIVLTTNASTTVIAHEIGHAFQARDIYPLKYSDGRAIDLVNSLVNPISIELDWNNGVGTRYYKTDLKQKELIRRLLMCGYSYPETMDISCGAVYGFTSGGLEGLLNVGFFSNGERKILQKHR